MSYRILPQGWCLVLVTSLLTAALAQAAPNPSVEEKGKNESPAEKTRKSLEQVRDVEIVEQPFAQFFSTLREQTKINFIVDHYGLSSAGIDPNSAMVTVKQKNIKVRNALKLVLNQYNLSSVILGDSVVITSEDLAMQRQMKQRVSLDLDAVPLSSALKQLSRETAANLMLDTKLKKEMDTAISLQLEDVPLDTAVRLMTEMAGLKPVRVGNVLYVTSKANANELRNDPDLGQPVQAVQPQYYQQQLQMQELRLLLNQPPGVAPFQLPIAPPQIAPALPIADPAPNPPK